MTATGSWLATKDAIAEPEEKVCTLAHQFHCLQGCGLQVTVRDGRMVLIQPAQVDDDHHRRCCVRGLSEVQHVYDECRLQTPMKRVGERGEGKFEAISWDEAIDILYENLNGVMEKYGPEKVFFRKCTEASVGQGFSWIPGFLHFSQNRAGGLDRGQANATDLMIGTSASSGQRHISDWVNSKTIIHWGMNLLESGMMYSRYFFDAKDAGAHMITIDTRFSVTASKSNEWICIRPGTDPALGLGMVNLILKNKWYDEDFMRAYTTFPFLVDDETHMVLSDMVDKIDPATGEVVVDAAGNPTQVRTPYVWDTVTDSAKYFNEPGVVAALEGSYEVDGKEYTTEFSLLLVQNAPYTVDWASEITGVPVDTIVALTDRYANGGPAVINYGLGGPDKYGNADVLGHSEVLLAALTGQCGKPGTGVGTWVMAAALNSVGLNGWSVPGELLKYNYADLAMYDLARKSNDIKAALVFGDTFAVAAASLNDTINWIKQMEFVAIVDIYHSTIVDYCDLVLPACSKFECEDDYTQVRVANEYVYLGQKCIDPLFDSKSDLQIERLILERWGFDKYLPKTYTELAHAQLDGLDPVATGGLSFEKLAKEGFMRVPDFDKPLVRWDNNVYPTYHTRIECYSEANIKYGRQFPEWETAQEAYEENPLKQKYPLYFVQGKTRYRIHSYFSASAWLRQFYTQHVDMNATDAEARGIKDGDKVRVFNDRGEFIAPVIINNSIAPGTTFMAETTYQRYFDKGSMQNVTNNNMNDRCYEMYYGPTIPYNDTLVQIEKA